MSKKKTETPIEMPHYKQPEMVDIPTTTISGDKEIMSTTKSKKPTKIQSADVVPMEEAADALFKENIKLRDQVATLDRRVQELEQKIKDMDNKKKGIFGKPSNPHAR